MLILPPSVAQCLQLRLRLRLRLRWELRAWPPSRLLHTNRKGAASFKRFRFPQPPPPRRPSLLEELFPEEIQRHGGRGPKIDDHVRSVPRLPLPEVDDLSEGFYLESDLERVQPQNLTVEAPAAKISPHRQLAILSLDTGSKSLIESDFRRIAPKGQHIDDWIGPGDILKSGSNKQEIRTRIACELI